MNVVLSTTRRAKAKKNLKKGEMEEEKPQVKQPEVKENQGAEDPEKKEPEEDPTCILKNPSRVLRQQEKYISYIPENRYTAVLQVRLIRPTLSKDSLLTLQNRKRGYVFL